MCLFVCLHTHELRTTLHDPTATHPTNNKPCQVSSCLRCHDDVSFVGRFAVGSCRVVHVRSVACVGLFVCTRTNCAQLSTIQPQLTQQTTSHAKFLLVCVVMMMSVLLGDLRSDRVELCTFVLLHVLVCLLVCTRTNELRTTLHDPTATHPTNNKPCQVSSCLRCHDDVSFVACRVVHVRSVACVGLFVCTRT